MDLQALSDADLVRCCREGQQAAWSTLVRRFQRLVYTVPRRARLPEATVADVFQVTFSRLFEYIHRLDDPSRVRAWLVTTARRETLRELSAGRLVEMTASTCSDADDEAPMAPPAETPGLWQTEVDVAQLERWHDLRTAVDRLEPRCRQLIELLFLSDPELPYAEVSQRLQMPAGSIGPTRSRCLAHLQKLLKGDGW